MYRAVVIGLGKIGLTYDFEKTRTHPSSHVSAYEADSDVQTVCGIDPDGRKAELLHSVNPEIRYFKNLKEAAADGGLADVDMVSVCTPPELHFPILEQLLRERIGRVIFCEKPLVRSSFEISRLSELLEECPDRVLVPNISRRWNTGIRETAAALRSGKYGLVKRVHVRYTRGIYNTGSHLFDLLHMWTGDTIRRVLALDSCPTSEEGEPTYSFYFEQGSGVKGYAEALDDRDYYVFEADMFLTGGKIEMRFSGDEICYYRLGAHHLFEGFRELVPEAARTGLLGESCLAKAVENIKGILEGKEAPACGVMDAVYPLRAAAALERSWKRQQWERIIL